jgi:hypothetical protein
MWDLWWTMWQWDRFFPEYFGFFPVSFIPPVLDCTETAPQNDHFQHTVAQ